MPICPTCCDDAPAEPPVAVVVAFDPGPLFHLGRVTIEGDVPPAARDQLGLAPGAPAVAADVLAAQQRLLTAIREAGPSARQGRAAAGRPCIPAEHLLDVAFRVTEGPYADIGAIQITGLKTMNEDYVRRRLLLRSGQRFSPTQLQAAREDLARHRRVLGGAHRAGEHVDPDGTIPILIDVTERPLHSVDVGAAYSTDLGVNAHRRLAPPQPVRQRRAAQPHRRRATRRQCRATGPATISASSSSSRTSSSAISRSRSDLGAVKQSLDAYDQRALTQRIETRPQAVRRTGRWASASAASRRTSSRKASRAATT